MLHPSQHEAELIETLVVQLYLIRRCEGNLVQLLLGSEFSGHDRCNTFKLLTGADVDAESNGVAQPSVG